jgi:hypothetical protein
MGWRVFNVVALVGSLSFIALLLLVGQGDSTPSWGYWGALGVNVFSAVSNGLGLWVRSR